ncbi:MAG: tetratricopeptide repeat protein [Bryobacteraceae bacterium]|jgi:hypothetical protein
MRIAVSSILLCALCALPVHARFNTPVLDGVIEPDEYGNHADGRNRKTTASGQTWYMTWDAAHLYIAISNANLAEAAVVYIDANPIDPPNGGTNADGNLTGYKSYDGTSFASLPFRAQFVAYFKQGYREYRRSDGRGNWGGHNVSFGAFAANESGNVRELAIPWSSITGHGMPPAFLFFAYLTSADGTVYGQVPRRNPAGPIGTSATAANYYAVHGTADKASVPPFMVETAAHAPPPPPAPAAPTPAPARPARPAEVTAAPPAPAPPAAEVTAAPAGDPRGTLDLGGTWQGNIAAPTAPATIITLQIKQQGRNVTVVHLDGYFDVARGKTIFEGVYHDLQVTGRNGAILLDDPDHLKFEKTGQKFARGSQPPAGNPHCEPGNPFHVTAPFAAQRGFELSDAGKYDQAICWFTVASKLGNAAGDQGLAYAYFNGQGVKQDYAKAFGLDSSAAERGNMYAQNDLAYMYENGKGAPKDHQKAVFWANKAKNQKDKLLEKKLNAQEEAQRDMAPALFLGGLVGRVLGPISGLQGPTIKNEMPIPSDVGPAAESATAKPGQRANLSGLWEMRRQDSATSVTVFRFRLKQDGDSITLTHIPPNPKDAPTLMFTGKFVNDKSIVGHTPDTSGKGDPNDTVTIENPNRLTFAKGGQMNRVSELYTFSPFIPYERRPYMDFALKYLKECEAGDPDSADADTLPSHRGNDVKNANTISWLKKHGGIAALDFKVVNVMPTRSGASVQGNITLKDGSKAYIIVDEKQIDGELLLFLFTVRG